jgi:chemosensory pili system protein ChpA (sensor histidine kinase/response regulator)
MAEALSDLSTLQRSLQRSLNTTEDDLAAQLRQTRDLQRNLLRTRMVDFDSVGERLHRLVRMTSLELGKSIELTIKNGRQEMDRLVLERMLPVFEHLLRNAVVHGIELPTQREAKGKPVQGRITIQLTQQSNDVIVNLQDDGSGIDQEALLAKARARLGQPQLMADPVELIFMSGLSTANEVSELAGCGA